MENGKQYVYMNHFTLGEETAACEKKQHPPFSRIFPSTSFLHCHFVFHFPITKLEKCNIVFQGVSPLSTRTKTKTINN